MPPRRPPSCPLASRASSLWGAGGPLGSSSTGPVTPPIDPGPQPCTGHVTNAGCNQAVLMTMCSWAEPPSAHVHPALALCLRHRWHTSYTPINSLRSGLAHTEACAQGRPHEPPQPCKWVGRTSGLTCKGRTTREAGASTRAALLGRPRKQDPRLSAGRPHNQDAALESPVGPNWLGVNTRVGWG